MAGSGRASAIALGLLTAGVTLAAPPLIVLDPGHGGSQEGAASSEGFLEKHVALQLCQQLKDELHARLTAQVVLTREEDVDLALSDRVTLVNQRQPDVFVSVHANSMPTKRQRARIEGVETYFLSANASGEHARSTAARENADAPQEQGPGDDTLQFILSDLKRTEAHVDSSRLAYAVHQKLVAATGAVDRGVQQAPFFVLTGVEVPAILVEVGFISHPVEGKKLRQREYQRLVASAIAEGVREFLAQMNRRAQASQP